MNSVKIQSQPLRGESNIPQQAPVLLPSIEIQTLQAELSLQKLSKEVIYLRNQQRESLKARRFEVLEKKKRAQERRESYLKEMSQLQTQLHEATEINRQQEDTIKIHSQTITILEGKIELMSKHNKELNESVLELQSELAEYQMKYQELQDVKAKENELFKLEKDKWLADREVLNKEKMSYELQIEVLTKSNEKSEQR